MLIRSQNNYTIVNINQIDTISYEDECIYAYSNDTKTLLGEYSEEQAPLVLDMIQGYYMGTRLFFKMPQEDEINEDMGR